VNKILRITAVATLWLVGASAGVVEASPASMSLRRPPAATSGAEASSWKFWQKWARDGRANAQPAQRGHLAVA
jgi:hypothetical protein